MPETNMYFTNADARLWTQLDGPGSALVTINCVDIGDADEPQGDVAREMCPDTILPGVSNVAIRTHGAPGEVTLQFTVPRGKTSDYLDTLAARRCPIPFYVLYAACASRDVFIPLDTDETYEGYTARWGILTGKGRTNQGSALRDGAAPTGVMRTYTVSFESLEDWYKLVGERITVAGILIWNDIAGFDKDVCGGSCGAPREACDRLIAVGDAAAGVAEIYFSANGGATWAPSAVAPYAVTMSVAACGGFPTGVGTWRVFAVRGTTDAGVADIAYSDDLGAVAAWTVVDLPTTNTEFASGSQSFQIINRNLMFVCTGTAAGTAGSICRGTSSGTVWELVATTTDVVNCLNFLNEEEGICGGESDVLYHTIDGGDTWTNVGGAGGAEITCCVMMTSKHWIIGYAAAFGVSAMWQTFDAGQNWEAVIINPPVAGATAILPQCLERVDDHCVWAGLRYTSGGNPFGSISRNVAGGASNAWEHNVTDATTSEGINGIWPCSYNKCFGVGGVQGALSTVMVAANS